MDGALTSGGYLIHDRDSLFTVAFQEILAPSGGLVVSCATIIAMQLDPMALAIAASANIRTPRGHQAPAATDIADPRTCTLDATVLDGHGGTRMAVPERDPTGPRLRR